MEQNNNFPKFDKGQVLTSEALNSYFGYLDEQQRLTRAKLLGIGIIEGLECELSENKLTIKKGSAVTADGYLIDLKEEMSYELIYKYDKKSMLAKQNPLIETENKDFETVLKNVDYVFYKNQSDAAKHNLSATASTSMPENWKTKYVLALMVDFASQDTITKCNELSCDIVQSNYLIEIRPVLINYSCFGKDYYRNLITYTAEVTYNKITEFIPLLPAQPFEYFKQAYEQMQASIIGKPNQITIPEITQVSNIISLNGDLFDDVSESDVTAVRDRLTEMHNIVDQQEKSKTSRFSGYFLDFLFQLRMAIREFLNSYHEFRSKYKKLPNNTKAYPRIVVIGFGEYRRQERFLPDNSYLDDVTILKKQLNRIFSMSTNFNYLDSSSWMHFGFIKKDSKLGEQSFPGFYNAKAHENWHAHSHSYDEVSHRGNAIDIYDEAPTVSECVLYIDGYYGSSVSSFYKLKKDLLSKFDFKSHTIYIHESQPYYFDEEVNGFNQNKTDYQKDIYAAYDKSTILKGIKNFKNTIDKITEGKPIECNSEDIKAMISGITTYCNGGSNLPAWYYLSCTKEFLLQFCDVKGIAPTARCRYGGVLYVFYTGHGSAAPEFDSSFITLIVGTL